MDNNIQNPGPNEEALAVQIFETFCAASTMGKILNLFREMCRVLNLKPTVMTEFYVKLKSKLAKSWRAQAIFRKLDVRSNFKIYNRGRTCPDSRLLIIGGGPCGLRTAIDAQMLGAKVVVVEKRDRMSRNNIVHLWPFVIQDLRNLAAKKFFGKFCAGSIDHISIRQLQFILLKVALILGVEFHEGVGFLDILEPKDTGTEKCGWKANVTPTDHPVSNYEFDVLIGADGKRNTLQGFKRKEFRGRLAIAITANFINKHTKEEASVPEISGTAFIFNQDFFNKLNRQFYIDLENLVYYKGETHYFVMTAKKSSLLQRNVLIKDYSETTSLLSRENIDYAALRSYAQDAASYSTNFQLPKMDFAVNHYGHPDVAVFDFTSMFAAENASRVLEKNGYKLLVCLVGDGLLEPFWPTGSGCARGFLSSLDACWAIRSWSLGVHPLAVLAERESIYRLLAQTTPQNLSPDFSHYTVDPGTRYKNLNKNAVLPHQVTGFYDTDDLTAKNIDAIESIPQIHTKKRKRDSQVHPDALLAWLKKQVIFFNLEIDNFATPFKNGLILCAVLHRYRPDLIDFASLNQSNAKENLKLVLDIFEKEFGLAAIPNIEEMIERDDNSDFIAMLTYLSQIYQIFKGEIPFIRNSRLGSPELEKKRSTTPRSSTTRDPNANTTDGVPLVRIPSQAPSESENVSSRKSRKRRSSSRYHGQSLAERVKKIREKNFSNEEQRRKEIAKFCHVSRLEAKSLRMLESNARPNAAFTTPVDEDYNISTYRQNAPEFKSRVKDLEKLLNPEHDRAAAAVSRTAQHGEFSSKIKTIEDQFNEGGSVITNKKPRDLRRAIGKIEKNDWNVKKIEEKIQENQLGKPPAHGKEKVPKWNREQFLERQTKIEHGLDQQESCEGKFRDIDSSLKQLDRQLKEGNALETGERGKNKVASLAGQFTKKNADDDDIIATKINNNMKPVKINRVKYDVCHVCKKNVYAMEKINTEDNHIFHKSCFKCHYCSLTLKIGSYMYDRDGKFGYNFFCSHHYGMMGRVTKDASKPPKSKEHIEYETLVETPLLLAEESSPIQILNRDETPERIELENQSHDVTQFEENEIDEEEWSGINFGTSAIEQELSANGDDESYSSNEEYSEAIDDSDSERITDDSEASDFNSTGSSERCQSYHDYSSGDEEGASGTEGSEQRDARERRRQEVAIQPPPLTSSRTSTEAGSDEESSSETSEAANSATEVSTDSEFAHDDPTPTRELPYITLNDEYVCSTRGTFSKHLEEAKKNNMHNYESKLRKKKLALAASKENKPNNFTKVQVKTGVIVNGNIEKKEKQSGDIKLELEKIIPTEPKAVVPISRLGDYHLSRTQSTGGIAVSRALELKKLYLLSPQTTVGLQKSDSASQLDTKLKNFHSNISECQKLLNPAPDISPSMQAFLDSSSRRNGGLLSPTNVSPLLTNSLDANSTKPRLSSFSFMTKMSANPTNISDNCEPKAQSTILEIKEKTEILTLPNISKIVYNESKSNINNDIAEETESICEKKDITNENNTTVPSQSPVLETSFVVPDIEWKKEESNTDMESDSLISTESTSDERSSKDGEQDSIAMVPPRVEIRKPCGEVMQLDSLMVVDDKYIGSHSSEEENDGSTSARRGLNQNKTNETINTQLVEKPHQETLSAEETIIKSDGHASPNSDSGNDITAFFTDNEPLDWAVDGTSIDIECPTNFAGQRKNSKHLSTENSWEMFLNDDFGPGAHVCGKSIENKSELPTSILAYDHSDIDFMDTGSEESLIENITTSKNREQLMNRGFVEFVDINVGPLNDKPVQHPVVEAINRNCDSPVNDRSMDFIEQGACVLNNDIYLKDAEQSNTSIEVSLVDKNKIEINQNNLQNSYSRSSIYNKQDTFSKDEKPSKIEMPSGDVKKIFVKSDNNLQPRLSISQYEEISIENVKLSSINKDTKKEEVFKEEISNIVNSNENDSLSISESKDSAVQKKSSNSPKTSRKMEELSRQKVIEKSVVDELVRDKMSKIILNSEKRMNRRSRSSISPECFGKKSSLIDNAHFEHKKVEEKSPASKDQNKITEFEKDIKTYGGYKPNVKLKVLNDENLGEKHNPNFLKNTPVISLNGKSKLKYPNNSEAFSLPDLPQAIHQETENILPNIIKNKEISINNTPDRKIMSKEGYNDISPLSHPTGIVPGFRQLSLDDCSGKLVQNVKSFRKSNTSNNDILNAQSKSSGNLYTSDYNAFHSESSPKKCKNRDSNGKKSIIKKVSDFFKSQPNNFGDKKSRGQKERFKSKEQFNAEEPSAVSNLNSDDDAVPPPIPPLPTNIGQFSGETENHSESQGEQQKNSCLLAFERHEKIKKIQYNLKVLEAKEREKSEQFDEAYASARKRLLHNNRIVIEQLLILKRCVRKIQFQRHVETFLLDDLLLEDQYFELRLKLLKPVQSKREKINKDMMDIVMKRQYLASNLNQITSRYHSRESEEELRREIAALSQDAQITK